jgi:hypothetical protein
MFAFVNLLLLLTALLSALTGVQAGARVPQAAVTVTQAPHAVTNVLAVPATVAGRPVAALPALPVSALAPVATDWNLTAAVPLFLSRRRE